MPDNNKWGPENPHPLSKLKTELVWEGKYDEFGNRRPVRLPDKALPLQRIETIDAPCDAAKAKAARQGDLFDQDAFAKSSHRDDFRNMLIWGDNKLALASLLEEYRGKVNLIYIDPPFDVGADFTMEVPLGEDSEASKDQSLLEAVAYRDTWGRGQDSYVQMMYERLVLMHELLHPEGSIYVHADYRVTHLLRMLLDDIFGTSNFQNNIQWCYNVGGKGSTRWARKHDTIQFVSKSDVWQFDGKAAGIARDTGTKSQGGIIKRDADGRLYQDKLVKASGKYYRYYLDEPKIPEDWWTDINSIQSGSEERLGYATQKPEALLDRIVRTSSREGNIVADFFCGSGTTLAVAERLGRRWIGVDLGRYSTHTARKRLIGVQRDLHSSNEPYRSFDVYNLGRYERQWWQVDRLLGADEEHRKLVLKFYGATGLESSPSPLLHGRKANAIVHVDRIDSIFESEEAESVAAAAQSVGAKELHILAWEFEMEIKRKLSAIEARSDVKIRTFQIPREIMEANRNKVQFFESGALSASLVKHSDSKIDVRLEHFTPALAEAPEAELQMLRERAVRSPFDFIDFWAIDFDWNGIEPFEHHWQDFRSRKDRALKTTSDAGWQYDGKGTRTICVKVIDVFGVDTTTMLEVQV